MFLSAHIPTAKRVAVSRPVKFAPVLLATLATVGMAHAPTTSGEPAAVGTSVSTDHPSTNSPKPAEVASAAPDFQWFPAELHFPQDDKYTTEPWRVNPASDISTEPDSPLTYLPSLSPDGPSQEIPGDSVDATDPNPGSSLPGPGLDSLLATQPLLDLLGTDFTGTSATGQGNRQPTVHSPGTPSPGASIPEPGSLWMIFAGGMFFRRPARRKKLAPLGRR